MTMMPWDEPGMPSVVASAAEFALEHEGRPVPQGRPRAFSRGGKLIVTKAEVSRVYELELAQAARARAARVGWVPYAADVELKLALRVYRAADQGDLTNFVKAVEDALTQAGIWLDDRRVVEVVATMFVDREHPRVDLVVGRAGP